MQKKCFLKNICIYIAIQNDHSRSSYYRKGKCPGFLGNSHVSYLFRSERSNQNLNWQQLIFTQGSKVFPRFYFSLCNSLNNTFPTSIDKNISPEAITLKNSQIA